MVNPLCWVDTSISFFKIGPFPNLRDVWFVFIIFQILQNFLHFYANSIDPDQMPRSAASDLGLHYLPCPFNGTLGINGLSKHSFVLILPSKFLSPAKEDTNE